MQFTERITKLWNKISTFEKERYMVATIHIPLNDFKSIIQRKDFVKGTILDPSDYYLLKKETK